MTISASHDLSQALFDSRTSIASAILGPGKRPDYLCWFVNRPFKTEMVRTKSAKWLWR
jgi:hypothetical protein